MSGSKLALDHLEAPKCISRNVLFMALHKLNVTSHDTNACSMLQECTCFSDIAFKDTIQPFSTLLQNVQNLLHGNFAHLPHIIQGVPCL